MGNSGTETVLVIVNHLAASLSGCGVIVWSAIQQPECTDLKVSRTTVTLNTKLHFFDRQTQTYHVQRPKMVLVSTSPSLIVMSRLYWDCNEEGKVRIIRDE